MFLCNYLLQWLKRLTGIPLWCGCQGHLSLHSSFQHRYNPVRWTPDRLQYYSRYVLCILRREEATQLFSSIYVTYLTTWWFAWWLDTRMYAWVDGGQVSRKHCYSPVGSATGERDHQMILYSCSQCVSDLHERILGLVVDSQLKLWSHEEWVKELDASWGLLPFPCSSEGNHQHE